MSLPSCRGGPAAVVSVGQRASTWHTHIDEKDNLSVCNSNGVDGSGIELLVLRHTCGSSMRLDLPLPLFGLMLG